MRPCRHRQFLGRPATRLLLLLLLLSAGAGAPAAAQPGLQATFFRGDDFREVLLTRTDEAIDFDWDNRSPAPGIPTENYCVRWTGVLQAPVTGTYLFTISTDDGMRVWLDGKRLFDEWRPQSPTTFTTRVALKAGAFYALRVDYYQLGYQARAQLAWQRPDANERRGDNLFGLLAASPEPIPASAFFRKRPARRPRPAEAPARASASAPQTAAAPARAAASAPQAAAAPARAAASAPQAAAAPARAAASAPQTAETPAGILRAGPRQDGFPVAASEPAPAPAPAQLPFTRGATIEVKNLFFEQGTADLLPASAPALNELAAALRAQPAVRLEIGGHTDNEGDSTANRRLSEARAQRVRHLLIERGIDSVRLAAVGYGGTRPVTTRPEPLQRARNRRVELTVK